MNKKMLSAAVVALTVAAGSADAGTKYSGTGNVSVLINSAGAGTASGFLGHIWNNPATNQYIGCNAYGTAGVYCAALSSTGKFGVCNAGSSFLAESLLALGTDVRITFTWNASGTCESITIEHSSQFAPKL